ncbi:MAG: nucleoside deaminase [Phycisphaerales bacterium]|nr:nucleoside deaminase [Planctomycetota bacterium]MBL6996860.1 nucleoside deaminase [Phycisphaerales bacterium]
MNDEAMMQHAISLAKQAALLEEVPIGAAVFHEGMVVGEGFNTKETNCNPTAHAEINAIVDASQHLGRWRMHGCTIVVTLEPCPMCAGAIMNARFDRVVFGASDQKAGACRTLYKITDDPRLNHRCEVIGGVLENNCIELLQKFFRLRR